MTTDTPKCFSNIRREQRVSGNAHTARWARNRHPNKGPQHGSQLHRVTVTHRVALNNITRTGNTMEQSAQKVVRTRPRSANTDSSITADQPSRADASGQAGGRQNHPLR